MGAAIIIRNLSVAITGKPILSSISAEIPEGKIVGLLGPSGAGKTTLIRSILGLQAPSDGDISVFGLAVGTKSLRSDIGYVTQSPSVYSDLTVAENLRYFGSLISVDRSSVDIVINDVDLTDCKHQLVGSLSGGQRARVSLAVALLGKPKLLLLDEPTVGLDPLLRQKLWHNFKKLSQQGVTILLSSHVMDEADKCDELLFIRDGKLLTTGTKSTILKRTNATSMEDAFIFLATGAES